MPLITVEQANNHLRLDLDGADASPIFSTDERLPDLVLKIAQAEAIVFNYLRVPAGTDPLANTSPPYWTEREVGVVQSAGLLVLSALCDDEIERTLGDYMGPDGVVPRLLARLRRPVIA